MRISVLEWDQKFFQDFWIFPRPYSRIVMWETFTRKFFSCNLHWNKKVFFTCYSIKQFETLNRSNSSKILFLIYKLANVYKSLNVEWIIYAFIDVEQIQRENFLRILPSLSFQMWWHKRNFFISIWEVAKQKFARTRAFIREIAFHY